MTAKGFQVKDFMKANPLKKTVVVDINVMGNELFKKPKKRAKQTTVIKPNLSKEGRVAN